MTEHASFNPGFPVIIYEEGMELPTEGTYYLVSGNGLWLHKDTGIVKAFVPVDQISILQDLTPELAQPSVGCNLPKLPFKHVFKIKKFFQDVVRLHRSEAATILLYNRATRDFKVQITDQRVSHGGVNYRMLGLAHDEETKDYLRVGTIHSHCDFDAFHSGTDIGDEESFDGLHCTFGHNDRDQFSISASIVVNGYRVSVDPETVLEGIQHVGEENYGNTGGWGLFSRSKSQDKLFVLDEPAEWLLKEWEEERDRWLSRVQSNRITFLRQPPPSDGMDCGAKVVWAGDLSQVQMRTVMGDGPFEVVERDGDKITIKTKVGLAKMSIKLFNKEGENADPTVCRCEEGCS